MAAIAVALAFMGARAGRPQALNVGSLTEYPVSNAGCAGAAKVAAARGQDTNHPNDALLHKTMDELLVGVADTVPGFGGMFLNPHENVLYVYALDPSDKAAIQKAIAARKKVEMELERLGIPREAVIIEVIGPIVAG